MATDSAERIYERILARVGAEELRVHCNKLLREKVQLATHKTLQDALRAWRRLQEVQQAGEQLQEKQSETSQTRSFTSDAVSSLVDTIRETQQLQRRLAASVRQLGVIPQLQEETAAVRNQDDGDVRILDERAGGSTNGKKRRRPSFPSSPETAMSGEDAFKDAGDVREDSNRASLDSHAISARDPQHPDSSSLATASSAPQLQESIAVSKYMAFLADHADKCMSFAEQVDRDPKHALLQELVGMVAAALNYLQVLGPNTLYPEQSIRILDDIERSLERAIRILQEQVAFPTTAETIAKLLPMVANLRDNYPHVKDLFSRSRSKLERLQEVWAQQAGSPKPSQDSVSTFFEKCLEALHKFDALPASPQRDCSHCMVQLVQNMFERAGDSQTHQDDVECLQTAVNIVVKSIRSRTALSKSEFELYGHFLEKMAAVCSNSKHIEDALTASKAALTEYLQREQPRPVGSCPSRYSQDKHRLQGIIEELAVEMFKNDVDLRSSWPNTSGC